MYAVLSPTTSSAGSAARAVTQTREKMAPIDRLQNVLHSRCALRMRHRQHRRALIAVALLGATSSFSPGVAQAMPPSLVALAAQPEGLVPPELLNSVTVEYPEALADEPDPPAGQVVVKLTIGTDGVPKDVEVEYLLRRCDDPDDGPAAA